MICLPDPNTLTEGWEDSPSSLPHIVQDAMENYFDKSGKTGNAPVISSRLRLTPVNSNLKSYGSRAFAVSASELWNKLKTHLFKNCFNMDELLSYPCMSSP